MLRLVCLRFVFLLATRALAAVRLSRRDSAWRNAEILLLRHQLAVVQRQLGERARPKVSWADRALIALLLGLIPKTRHHRLRLIVTPGTILRWRRDILRRRWAAKSQPKGRPTTRRNIKALVVRMARENAGSWTRPPTRPPPGPCRWPATPRWTWKNTLAGSNSSSGTAGRSSPQLSTPCSLPLASRPSRPRSRTP